MKKPLPIVTVAEEFCAENLKLKRVNAELLEACKKALIIGHECADEAQQHADPQCTLDWLELEHSIKQAIAEAL